ncbi:MAG: GNAT family N-acetyltransferase [Candidatus Saccharimonas aalborgensis]
MPRSLLPLSGDFHFIREGLRVYDAIHGVPRPGLPSLRHANEILRHFRHGNAAVAGIMGQRVVGLANYYTGGRGQSEAWLHGLAVDPDVRRQHVGTHMLGFILDHMKSSGASICKLESLPEAVGFYEANGFTERDESDDTNRLMVYSLN